MPLQFFDEMLSYTNLASIGSDFETIKLFCLPYNCRIYISNLLLSAVKIDRDQGVVSTVDLKAISGSIKIFIYCFFYSGKDGGFYSSLFNGIRHLLIDSLRNLNDSEDKFVKHFKQTQSKPQSNRYNKKNKTSFIQRLIEIIVQLKKQKSKASHVYASP